MTDRHTLECLITELADSACVCGAQDAMDHVDRVRSLLADNAPAAELALSVAALVQASASANFKQYTEDARRGAKILAAAKAGHRTVHGSAEDKAARYAAYQKTVNRKHAELPAIKSWRRLSELAAREHGCCSLTIRTHTKNTLK